MGPAWGSRVRLDGARRGGPSARRNDADAIEKTNFARAQMKLGGCGSRNLAGGENHQKNKKSTTADDFFRCAGGVLLVPVLFAHCPRETRAREAGVVIMDGVGHPNF